MKNFLFLVFITASAYAQQIPTNSPLIGEWECGGRDSDCESYMLKDDASYMPQNRLELVPGTKESSVSNYFYGDGEEGYNSLVRFVASYDGTTLKGEGMDMDDNKVQVEVKITYDKKKDVLLVDSYHYKEGKVVTTTFRRVKN